MRWRRRVRGWPAARAARGTHLPLALLGDAARAARGAEQSARACPPLRAALPGTRRAVPGVRPVLGSSSARPVRGCARGRQPARQAPSAGARWRADASPKLCTATQIARHGARASAPSGRRAPVRPLCRQQQPGGTRQINAGPEARAAAGRVGPSAPNLTRRATSGGSRRRAELGPPRPASSSPQGGPQRSCAEISATPPSPSQRRQPGAQSRRRRLRRRARKLCPAGAPASVPARGPARRRYLTTHALCTWK